MGTILNNSVYWVTTNNLPTTMSRLLSSFMLLSLMVMVVNTQEWIGMDGKCPGWMITIEHKNIGQKQCLPPEPIYGKKKRGAPAQPYDESCPGSRMSWCC